MNHIVLVEPAIPPNTGNIARTCVATGSRLHLVEPLGFSITEKSVKRAGLDYWFDTDLQIWPDLDSCLREFKIQPVFFVTTKAKRRYTDISYPDQSVFFFGKEDKGLPEDLLFTHLEQCIRIPMTENNRSLNLANSVSIVLYEALRQQGFPGLL